MKTLLSTFLLLSVSITANAKDAVYEVDGQKYQGYFLDKGRNAPLVLIVHDWDGLTDYEMKRAEMLSKQGYSVFAVDLFGQGVRPTEMEERKKRTGELYADRTKMRKLLEAGLREAEKQKLNVKDAVVIGYCFGGAAALEFARSGADLDGFVSFHGGLETPQGQDYKNVKGPVFVFHGTADTAVPMEHFAALAKSMEAANVPHEMTTYSGAPHAFTVFGSEAYRKEADQKSWTRFLEFMKEKFRKK